MNAKPTEIESVDKDGVRYILSELWGVYYFCIFDLDAGEYFSTIKGPEAAIRKRYTDCIAKVKA